jgi:hypothetical protein
MGPGVSHPENLQTIITARMASTTAVTPTNPGILSGLGDSRAVGWGSWKQVCLREVQVILSRCAMCGTRSFWAQRGQHVTIRGVSWLTSGWRSGRCVTFFPIDSCNHRPAQAPPPTQANNAPIAGTPCGRSEPAREQVGPRSMLRVHCDHPGQLQ